jgi:putative protein kinase ArgK-like GTPase of G3E family
LSLGSKEEGWESPVAAVSALTGKGVEELCGYIEDHRKFLKSSEEGLRRSRKQLKRELSLLVSKRIFQDTLDRISDVHIDKLLDKTADPQTISDELIGGGK